MKLGSIGTTLLLAIGASTSTGGAANTPPGMSTNSAARPYPGAGGDVYSPKSSRVLAAEAPQSPSRLEATVCAATRIELVWACTATSCGVIYEVREGGKIVGSTDGVSFVASDLTAGREYTFQVTAISATGQRSAPVEICVHA